MGSNPCLEGSEYVLSVPTFEDLGFFVNIYERGTGTNEKISGAN